MVLIDDNFVIITKNGLNGDLFPFEIDSIQIFQELQLAAVKYDIRANR